MGSDTMAPDTNGTASILSSADRTGINLNTDGAFRIGQPRGLAEIRDGTSNTVLLSEVLAGQDDLRGSDNTWDVRGMWAWHSMGSSLYTHRNTPNSSVGDALYALNTNCIASSAMPCDNTQGGAIDQHHAAARSRHPGGVGVAFADGHVSFVSDTIDLTTWKAISTIAGQEVISAAAF